MDKKHLWTHTTIAGKEVSFNADFRNIIDILIIFTEPNLLEGERIEVALEMFYNEDSYKDDLETAIKEMFFFINCGEEAQTTSPQKPLYNWEQDYDIIIAPVNKTLGFDVRGKEFLHWWTFLSAFMEMGECTLNTYMGIRDKLNRGKKLEKWEEKIYKDQANKIRIKQKYDKETQAIMDEIMGV